jgi:hypothetical protein
MSTIDLTRVPIKPDDARKWMQAIEDAEADARHNLWEKWSLFREVFERGPKVNRMRIKGGLNVRSDGDEQQGLNVIAAAVLARKAYVYHQSPSFVCRPRTQTWDDDARGKSKVAQAALTTEWAEAEIDVELSKAWDDAEVLGTGIARVAYQPAGLFVPVENYEVDFDEETAPERSPEETLLKDQLEAMGVVVDRPDAHVAVSAISPFNFIPAPGYDEIAKMPWKAVRHLIHESDLKTREEFRGIPGLKDVQADLVAAQEVDRSQRQSGFVFADPKHVAVYELWYSARVRRPVKEGGETRMKMVRETRVLWLLPRRGKEQQGPLVLAHYVADDVGVLGSPFVDFRPMRSRTGFWGMSRVEQMLPAAEEMQQLMDAASAGTRAAFALKVLVKHGVFGKNEMHKLGSDQPEVVQARIRGAINNAATVLNIPAFPQEFALLMNLFRSFFAEIGAGDEAMRGGRSSAKSATESASRATAFQTRADYDLRGFEKFLRRVARSTFLLMQHHFTAERWASLGEDGTSIRFSRNNLLDEYDIQIHVGSTKPAGPEMEREAYMGFLNALAMAAQALQTAGATPDITAEFYDRALELWEQDSPAMRDAFSKLVGQSVAQARQAPATGPDGQAADPLTGESLNGQANGSLADVAQGALPNTAADAMSPLAAVG